MADKSGNETALDDTYGTIERGLQPDDHAVFTAINEWERHSIGKIQLAAQQARDDLRKWFEKKREDTFKSLVQAHNQADEVSTTADKDLTTLKDTVRRLRDELMEATAKIRLEHDRAKAPIYLLQFAPKLNDRAKEHAVFNDSTESIDVPGTPRLALTALEGMTLAEQKQALGERLFVLVQQIDPTSAAKITGMFLEWKIRYILLLIHSPAVLREKVSVDGEIGHSRGCARSSRSKKRSRYYAFIDINNSLWLNPETFLSSEERCPDLPSRKDGAA